MTHLITQDRVFWSGTPTKRSRIGRLIKGRDNYRGEKEADTMVCLTFIGLWHFVLIFQDRFHPNSCTLLGTLINLWPSVWFSVLCYSADAGYLLRLPLPTFIPRWLVNKSPRGGVDIRLQLEKTTSKQHVGADGKFVLLLF